MEVATNIINLFGLSWVAPPTIELHEIVFSRCRGKEDDEAITGRDFFLGL